MREVGLIMIRNNLHPMNTIETNPTDNTAPRKSSFRSILLEIMQTLLLAVVLYFLIDAFIARVRVENVSMEPTLVPGEFLVVNKLSYKTGEIKHGDIIVFHYPLNPDEDYIKRVIGLPGDAITIIDGQVSVNGYLLDEPYIAAPPARGGEWIVPQNAVFVMGDNRNESSDSRDWGFVPDDFILGKALFVYWPFNQAKILTLPHTVNAAAFPTAAP